MLEDVGCVAGSVLLALLSNGPCVVFLWTIDCGQYQGNYRQKA